MYQTQSKIKTQAQEIRWNRWQRLVANYPNSNKLKGLKDGEVQAELGKYYGVNDVTYWLDIPTIENWLKKQQRNFILVMSFSILCLLVWAGFEINIIVGVLGESGWRFSFHVELPGAKTLHQQIIVGILRTRPCQFQKA